ncbi:MAG: hypothetical protein ACLUVI_09795 [Acutalibacteraceae bacterium]
MERSADRQTEYLCLDKASCELSMPQHFPFPIRRFDFGATITLQAEWEAGENGSETTPA